MIIIIVVIILIIIFIVIMTVITIPQKGYAKRGSKKSFTCK